jgi:hypothetical protein
VTYSPWTTLRNQPDILVHSCDLDGADAWWCPDERVVLLHHELGQAARRSRLTHELVHIERGDQPGPTDWHDRKIERTVEAEAARRLVALEHLADCLAWTLDVDEVAELLWVDERIVRARLDNLTLDERTYIDERIRAKEESA